MGDRVIDPKDLAAGLAAGITMSERPTVQLDPAELQPFMLACASLERLGPEMVHAWRLGLLVMLQQTVRLMLHEDAKADLVQRARDIIELLAKLPWDSGKAR
jgi:hypothetical protein